MSTMRVIKISVAWVTIAWIVCYLAFGLIPGLGPTVMPYLLHTNMPMQNIFSFDNFIAGLILWNLIVVACVALAGLLANSNKK